MSFFRPVKTGAGLAGGPQMSSECLADDHEPDEGLTYFVDCQDKVYLVCQYCAALWDGERWLD